MPSFQGVLILNKDPLYGILVELEQNIAELQRSWIDYIALISGTNCALEYNMADSGAKPRFGLSHPHSFCNSPQSAVHFQNSESVIPAAMDKGSLYSFSHSTGFPH